MQNEKVLNEFIMLIIPGPAQNHSGLPRIILAYQNHSGLPRIIVACQNHSGLPESF